jgi:regulatory protein
MPTVTALRPARRPARSVEVEVDGLALGPVPEAAVARLGLASGVTIDDETLAALRTAAQRARALLLIDGYLAHRPRSEAEVRQRLRRAGFEEGTVDETVQTLVGQGLLDDRRFAALWVESRTAFKPRSQRMLALELRRKGLGREQIEEALAEAGTDETALAIEAGRQRLRAFGSGDEETFRQRMGGYLSRRGFSYEQVRAATEALWQEAHQPE